PRRPIGERERQRFRRLYLIRLAARDQCIAPELSCASRGFLHTTLRIVPKNLRHQIAQRTRRWGIPRPRGCASPRRAPAESEEISGAKKEHQSLLPVPFSIHATRSPWRLGPHVLLKYRHH